MSESNDLEWAAMCDAKDDHIGRLDDRITDLEQALTYIADQLDMVPPIVRISDPETAQWVQNALDRAREAMEKDNG